MPDDEGYILPGELGLGSYGAGEMDLGEPVRRLAGFGRDLDAPEGLQEGPGGDERVFGCWASGEVVSPAYGLLEAWFGNEPETWLPVGRGVNTQVCNTGRCTDG